MSDKTSNHGFSRTAAWCWHHLVLLVALLLLVMAGSVLVLRFYVLPNADEYRERIAGALSEAAGLPITIGHIDSAWEGLHPQLNLHDVEVHDKSGRAALTLRRVDATLSWLSLPAQSPRLRALDIYDSDLDIRRDAAGRIWVAGIEMGGDNGQSGFSDWVLAQHDIEVHDSTVTWTDELRTAPTLKLGNVGLQIVNAGRRHRFGLRATPPSPLASTLDVRGDFSGRSIKRWAEWSGRLYADLDRADLAAWRTWLPLPVDIEQGTGGVRTWVTLRKLGDLAAADVAEVVADVRLADVRGRAGKDLPELDLPALRGRLAWKQDKRSLAFSARQLSLTTTGNLLLAPMDFSYHTTLGAAGEPLKGEIKASALDIAPLAALADHLPLAPDVRQLLTEWAPHGLLHEVNASWEGTLPQPQRYQLRARFEALGFTSRDSKPGLSGLTGTLEASEKDGTLDVKSPHGLRLDMPLLFKDELAFDTVSAHLRWTRDDKAYRIKIENAAFANADLEGSLQGSYQSVPQQPGIADLSGKLTRADARAVTRYLPLQAARSGRPWLEAAFLAGTSNDVQFKLKGDLRDYPFPEDKHGQFHVIAKVTGVLLHYGDSWPNIERINGELAFRGKGMQIDARDGYTQNVRLTGVKAVIPDLSANRILTVTGDADGATADFLRFITVSPVTGYIDHFTDGMRGDGPGRLRLKLDIPLYDVERTRVAGSLAFTNNRLLLDPALPPLEQTTGSVEFTEHGMNIPAAKAQFLGSPLAMAGNTRDGALRVNINGKFNSEAMRSMGNAGGGGASPQWLGYVRGITDWSGALSVRNKNVDLVVESNLQGLALNLPLPLNKPAGDALPLRLERRFLAADRDQLTLSLGEMGSARLLRRFEDKRTVIERGTVRLGARDAPEPARPGVYVSGTLKALDADAWLKIASAFAGKEGAKDGDDVQWMMGGIDVTLGTLEFYNRHFGELTVKSSGPQAGAANYAISGREVDGNVGWNDRERKLVARLKTLIVPATRPEAAAASTTAPATTPGEQPGDTDASRLPSFDVVADNFQFRGKSFGKLELKAAPQGRDWRVEQLRLTTPEDSLTASGVWQSWIANPRTDIKLEWTVNDIGKTLTRLGYVDGVKGGKAQIAGKLSWAGGPQSVDYTTLSGDLTLQAENGQFVHMEPGIGKLLGILSLQSLPRRLKLDFNDVFSNGFAFDQILSNVKIDKGVASSDSFFIAGPAARVVLNGNTNLARETQNLNVRVSPRLSGGASLAAIVAGPWAVVGAYVAQRLLKDPLDGLLAYNYSVTGTWNDPVVTRVSHPAAISKSDGEGQP